MRAKLLVQIPYKLHEGQANLYGRVTILSLVRAQPLTWTWQYQLQDIFQTVLVAFEV